MNLVIDYGNSRIKAGLFKQANLTQQFSFEEDTKFYEWLAQIRVENVIISSVARQTNDLLKKINSDGKIIVMSQSLPLPIIIKYTTPETLGVDRIAAACGAFDIMPNKNCLVIDLGTCINYEFVDEHANYHGGAISPGIKMRFQAMHTFTARLPLVKLNEHTPLTGNSTESCMQSGVANGVLAELDGIIERYEKKYPTMGVILCGGDAPFFENKLKHPIFVAPNLVLSGLNRILLHNVNF
ncbi:MAG: type III pantothenate kinase [Cyclobacteriaceae bacterium]|nr:type III pantothenate kinase [Cyclobacteriaceae bacterium]